MNDVKLKDVNNKDIPRIDLKSVEEITLPNGNKYIKYIDPKEKKPVLLKGSSDEEGIILVPINQIEKHQYMLNGLNQEQKNIISYFIDNKDRFNPSIAYINFEDGIALDETNRVICCWFNKETNKPNVRYADVVRHEKKEKIISNEIEATVDDIDYSAVVDTLEISNEAIEIKGYRVDMQTLEQYHNYPELLDRKNMKPDEKFIWLKIIDAYNKKKSEKEIVNSNVPKIKTLSNYPKQNSKMAGFANQMLMASLSGFTIGLLFSIIFLLVKNFF